MKDLLFFVAVMVEDAARAVRQWLVPDLPTPEAVCPYGWNPRHRCSLTCFVDAHPSGSARGRAPLERGAT